ncbi:YybS family protein [Lutispora thermophila]|uniref:Uncharacterized conserved protein YybS, DUF2232 family n=1 Tax=Lutispora thermophila DSM 19022 TaxID=1122184 RepID=A0A1M6GTD0_9FIRM|nr:YybS family protein [Lutispora thermophila]SHJ13225.1 Uncharacterized conserved protein YybS, DUF2232 family [Lutispora thermophila DSM 19022]
MNKMNTKALVEGAIFASVTAVLGILVYYMPFLSLLSMFWPTPIIIIGFRNGFKVSIISAVVAAIIVAIFTEPFSGIYLFLVFGIAGIIMGHLMSKKVNPALNIAVSGIILAVCSVFGLLFGFFMAGQSATQAMDLMISIMQESIDSAASVYRSIGMSEEQLSNIISTMKESLVAIRYVMPTLFLLSGILFSFVNYKFVKVVLNRMKYEIADVKPFSKWRIPDNFSMGMLVILLLSMAATYFNVPNMQTVQLNIIYIIKWVFAIIGLSVACYLLDKYGISKALKIIIMFFIFTSFSNYLVIVGLIDTVFDFRKLNKRHIGGI